MIIIGHAGSLIVMIAAKGIAIRQSKTFGYIETKAITDLNVPIMRYPQQLTCLLLIPYIILFFNCWLPLNIFYMERITLFLTGLNGMLVPMIP